MIVITVHVGPDHFESDSEHFDQHFYHHFPFQNQLQMFLMHKNEKKWRFSIVVLEGILLNNSSIFRTLLSLLTDFLVFE